MREPATEFENTGDKNGEAVQAKRDYLISVVIPVYNEEENLPELLSRLEKVFASTAGKFELVLVNDGSGDNTAEILREAIDKCDFSLVAVTFNRNYGQHSAVMAGFAQTRGEVVITLDADLQNPPEEIPRLLAEMDTGHDVVGTIRENRHDTMFRKVASKMTNFTIRKLTGQKMKDFGCMLRAYRRPVILAMLECKESSTFIPILANMFAGNTSEIPVQHSERAGGKSQYSLRKLIRLHFDLLTCASTAPLRFITYLGVVTSGMSILSAAVLITGRLIFGTQWAVGGIFTVFAGLFLFLGIQCIAMGIFGEYIGRIYQDVRGRPRYFIKEISENRDEI